MIDDEEEYDEEDENDAEMYDPSYSEADEVPDTDDETDIIELYTKEYADISVANYVKLIRINALKLPDMWFALINLLSANPDEDNCRLILDFIKLGQAEVTLPEGYNSNTLEVFATLPKPLWEYIEDADAINTKLIDAMGKCPDAEACIAAGLGALDGYTLAQKTKGLSYIVNYVEGKFFKPAEENAERKYRT